MNKKKLKAPVKVLCLYVCAVAAFVFFTASAWTGVVAAYLQLVYDRGLFFAGYIYIRAISAGGHGGLGAYFGSPGHQFFSPFHGRFSQGLGLILLHG